MPKKYGNVFETNDASEIRVLRYLCQLGDYLSVRRVHCWCDAHIEDLSFALYAKKAVSAHFMGTPSGPIFTFARETASELPFCTGSHDLYDALMWHIAQRRGLVVKNTDMPVPFSQGIGGEDMFMFKEHVVMMMTTCQEFEDTFDTDPDALLATYPKRATQKARRRASLTPTWLMDMPNT